jgi:integrase/recombinase XerC
MLDKTIGMFKDYLSYEKHFSPHTIGAYYKDLLQFSAYLSEQFEVTEIRQVNHQMIRSWLVELMNEKVSGRSVSRKLSTLKTFYKYLLREGVVDINPLSKVQAPKIEKRLPVFVEEKPMQRLLDEQKGIDGEQVEFGHDYEGRRNRLLIMLFYSTGIRLSELIGLKQVDVDFYKQTIKVLGKRNKERIIPITRELSAEIASFIEMKEKEQMGIDYLLLTKRGDPLYPKLVYLVVKKYLSVVTSIEKRSPHVLRHTFATHLLNKGADLNAIKELLGHANLAATQVYTHNSIERLKSIYKNKHPRA